MAALMISAAGFNGSGRPLVLDADRKVQMTGMQFRKERAWGHARFRALRAQLQRGTLRISAGRSRRGKPRG